MNDEQCALLLRSMVSSGFAGLNNPAKAGLQKLLSNFFVINYQPSTINYQLLLFINYGAHQLRFSG